MIGLRESFKVVLAIVVFAAIDVMRLFAVKEKAADLFFNNQDGTFYVASGVCSWVFWRSHMDVAARCFHPSTLPSVMGRFSLMVVVNVGVPDPRTMFIACDKLSTAAGAERRRGVVAKQAGTLVAEDVDGSKLTDMFATPACARWSQ